MPTRIVAGADFARQRYFGSITEASQAIFNVKHDGIAVEVNENLQSVSNPAVWLAGDVLALARDARGWQLGPGRGRALGDGGWNRTELDLLRAGSGADVQAFAGRSAGFLSSDGSCGVGTLPRSKSVASR